MGRIATFDKKGCHFQTFALEIFVIAANATKAQKLGGMAQGAWLLLWQDYSIMTTGITKIVNAL